MRLSKTDELSLDMHIFCLSVFIKLQSLLELGQVILFFFMGGLRLDFLIHVSHQFEKKQNYVLIPPF